MNVRLFVYKNHYALGFNIDLVMENVKEEKQVVNQQQRLKQVLIHIAQLVTFLHNAIHALRKIKILLHG